MSQIVRQNELFSGEDFTKLYKSFQQIDFTAYDYDTIRASLIEYIRINYPENFNDYIASSEYIAMIELLSYLGTSLAFRTDLNSRENFLDTAERKESIIRLARTLSYNPKRNIPASGLFKIIGVSTTDSVIDSQGRDLSNLVINWNDGNNEDAYEQFLTVLNSSFISTNPYGRPIKRGSVANVLSELYEINNIKKLEVSYNVQMNVDGELLPFDVVNADFLDREYFYERHPNPENGMNIIYRNDGQGAQSNDTGFFLMFKQGRLSNIDFRFDYPIKNRIVDIDATNINETDVFVQEINPDGTVIDEWKKIPNIEGNNIIFNSVALDQRKIYSVISDFSDKVKLKFADGNFGDIPTGIFRTWFRQSANKSYTIKPENIGIKNITIPYVNAKNQQHSLKIYFTLVTTVSNSVPSETIDEIKQRAPQVFYTQNRMVNNEDYNVFPLTRGNQILKIRSINRTYAGHSRYIDINDPTGFHKDLLIYGDDGVLYKDDEKQSIIVDTPTITDLNNFTKEDLQDFIKNKNLSNFFYNTYLKDYETNYMTTNTYSPFTAEEIYRLINPSDTNFDGVFWKTQPDNYRSSFGYFSKKNSGITDPTQAIVLNLFINVDSDAAFRFFRENSKIKYITTESTSKFAQITNLNNAGTPSSVSFNNGPIELSQELHEYAEIKEIYPGLRTNFTQTEIDAINALILDKRSFQLGYDIDQDLWYTLNIDSFDENSSTFNDFSSDVLSPNSWLVSIIYQSPEENGTSYDKFKIITRGIRFIFESYEDVRFYLDEERRSFDTATGQFLYDQIILQSNNKKTTNVEIWTLSNDNRWYNADDTISYPRNFVILDGRYSNVLSAEIIGSTETPLIETGYIDLAHISAVLGTQLKIVYSNEQLLGKDIKWETIKPIILEDGQIDQRKVEIVPIDEDKDGIYDEPFVFGEFVNDEDYVIFKEITDFDGYNYYIPAVENILETFGAVVVDDLQNFTVSDTIGVESIDNINLMLFDNNTAIENFITNILSYPDDSDRQLFLTKLQSKTFMNKQTKVFYDIIDTVLPTTFVFSDISEVTERYITRNGRSFSSNTADTERNNGYNQKYGDSPIYFIWKHYSPQDNRIDPCPTNIIDSYILTNSYYNDMLIWKNERKGIETLPVPPTSEDLRIEFSTTFNEYKMISDELIFNSGKFKLLFGPQSDEKLQATFRVVKNINTTISDNEIKTKVIQAIDQFFDVNNWDFGESFYYTELSAFIHRQLSSIISSVVIVPKNYESSFGDLFQIKSEPNELFMSTATVTDVEIVNTLTDVNMRIRR